MRTLPATAAIALATIAAAPSAEAPRVRTGRYVLQATAKVDATGLPPGEERAEAVALVAPGAGARDVEMSLRARGYECDLAFRVERGGALVATPGQLCRVALDREDARGAVDARLTSGKGRLTEDALALDLAWDLSGKVAMRMSGGTVNVLGTDVAVPGGGWTPAVPVRGTVTARAEGERDPPARR